MEGRRSYWHTTKARFSGNSNLPRVRRRTDIRFQKKEYICEQENIDNHYCNSTELGEFILSPNATDLSKNVILTQAIHLKDPPAVNYPIKKTGYYCVGTYSNNIDYKAIVEFRNAYGELPGAQIAKLPFYGGMTIVYAVVGV